MFCAFNKRIRQNGGQPENRRLKPLSHKLVLLFFPETPRKNSEPFRRKTDVVETISCRPDTLEAEGRMPRPFFVLNSTFPR